MKLPWNRKKEGEPLSPLEGYNRWAATYAEESNPIKNYSNELIEKLLPNVRGKTVLDAGCGTGHFCRLLESRRAEKITGIDLSPAMLEVARKVCPSTEFICQDLSSYPLGEDKYDLVICALVIGHIADISPALSQLLGSLKKGGSILISDFHPYLTLNHSRRTFKVAGAGTFEIQHHLHLFQDIVGCFYQHGVMLEHLEEPRWNGMPVIYGMKARRM